MTLSLAVVTMPRFWDPAEAKAPEIVAPMAAEVCWTLSKLIAPMVSCALEFWTIVMLWNVLSSESEGPSM